MNPDQFPVDPATIARRDRLRDLRGRLWPARAAHVIRSLGRPVHRVVRTHAVAQVDPAIAFGAVGLVVGMFVADLIALRGDGILNDYGRFSVDSVQGLVRHLRALEPQWVAWSGWMLLSAGQLLRGLLRFRFQAGADRRAPRRHQGPIDQYLALVAEDLRALPAHQRREVVRELREHLLAVEHRRRFADLAAIELRFGSARDIARGIRRAKVPRILRFTPATRGQAAGWLAVGLACLWHSALLVEMGMTLESHRVTGIHWWPGRLNWWEDPERTLLLDVVRVHGAAMARGEPLAWLLAAWVGLGLAMTLRGMVLLARRDSPAQAPATTPR